MPTNVDKAPTSILGAILLTFYLGGAIAYHLPPFTGITMLPQGGMTDVIWAIYGPMPFLAKVMHLFINMDRTIGRIFEIGLAGLKKLAER